VTTPFLVTALGARHTRKGFRCGVAQLDGYFASGALGDVQRRATMCSVAVHNATGRVAGFYALSASGVPLHEIPARSLRRLPRHPSIPVARLSHLAVDVAYQGGKLGAALLWDAVLRAARLETGMFALVASAHDEAAAAFYEHHGFRRLEGLQLVLPLTDLPRDKPKVVEAVGMEPAFLLD
jgi:ribosomal protein S18 acetylase RimI-like enzyme